MNEISDFDLNLRGRRVTSGGEISLLCSPNTPLPNAISRFPIPYERFPADFPEIRTFKMGSLSRGRFYIKFLFSRGFRAISTPDSEPVGRGGSESGVRFNFTAL